MRYIKAALVNNKIYHIVVRRIEDKLLFKDIYVKDIYDYYRGITVEFFCL